MSGFHGAVSVITGGAAGIGRAFAVELGQRGGRVVVADVDAAGLEQTVALIERAGGRARAIACDVRDPRSIEALADATEAWAGVPDLAVLNAGVLSAGPLATTTAEAIDRLVAVNVLGVVHGCRIFAARMLPLGRGRLLNVASIAGLLPVPQLSAYAATKAAVVGLSESLHAELRPHGIGVTVLCPSFTRTGLVANGAATGDGIRGLGQQIMDRVGATPERVAHVGLEAAARGRLYAIDTVHGRVAWWAKRAAPRVATRLASLASARID